MAMLLMHELRKHLLQGKKMSIPYDFETGIFQQIFLGNRSSVTAAAIAMNHCRLVKKMQYADQFRCQRRKKVRLNVGHEAILD